MTLVLDCTVYAILYNSLMGIIHGHCPDLDSEAEAGVQGDELVSASVVERRGSRLPSDE